MYLKIVIFFFFSFPSSLLHAVIYLKNKQFCFVCPSKTSPILGEKYAFVDYLFSKTQILLYVEMTFGYKGYVYSYVFAYVSLKFFVEH